jgi:hypothetical protein
VCVCVCVVCTCVCVYVCVCVCVCVGVCVCACACVQIPATVMPDTNAMTVGCGDCGVSTADDDWRVEAGESDESFGRSRVMSRSLK